DRDVRIDGFASSSMRNDLDLAPFERIEAVKGPSSMLYGQGSLGGFINMVRKKPQAETELSGSAQLGSFRSRRVEVDATGSVAESDNVLARVTVAYDDSGSFVEGVNS